MLLGIALLSLLIWVYLLTLRGGFWRSAERLTGSPRPRDSQPVDSRPGGSWPAVTAVVPARNEAEVIAESLTSLLEQDYPGSLTVLLVDDHSDDDTAALARAAAQRSRHPGRFELLRAEALPPGWTGKLWALQQGSQAAGTAGDFLWFSDADIHQPADTLRRLVAKAETERRDLVSLMVALTCQSFWERLLIPPFIYFFQKLYPFAWVKDPKAKTAAAAGGCILLRRAALQRIGGVAAIRDALIDDCSLAAAVKASRPPESGGIWLGLAEGARSIRPYSGLRAIWDMVARTAYTQLHHSPLLLAGTLAGMALTYLAPPLLLLAAPWHQQPWTAIIAGFTWLLMSLSLLPTLRLYRQPWWIAPLLPLAAGLYSAMTFDSAWRHWRGVGGQWKGRVQGRHAG
ncbi:glycosyltransferase [Pelagibius marinus]|uniref:glycosyltransferase n=1 Tax=Pelagibius marinus TaxID=2762760 RepID=UPI0018721881|nr:glycosyltransferase [Pelagibius marinus]